MRLEQTHAWRARAERLIPGCAQTFSKSPLSFVQGVAPGFLARAEGALVWDVDGNRYIDYSMGLGPVILGHADPAVNAAARRQMELGISFSLPHTVEVELAEHLTRLIPCAGMVRFGKNGSDATAAAVRVARAFTGRDKVARCGYHGWQDWYIGSTSRHLGVPEPVRRLTLTFPYNDLAAAEALLAAHRGEIACVILEPVTFTPPLAGFLEGLRELCRREGALLVFDEVITGFRLALGGAQQYFGVTPDLACFGKAMANGFPLSAVVGRAEVMRWFEKVFFSGTHGGEAVSLAAGLATIRELERRKGIERLWRLGARLKEGASSLAARHGLQSYLECAGYPPFTGFRFHWPEEPERLLLRSLFQQECLKRGVLTLGNHMLSLAHEESIIDGTLAVYDQVFAVLADAIERNRVEAALEGRPMQPIIRQA